MGCAAILIVRVVAVMAWVSAQSDSANGCLHGVWRKLARLVSRLGLGFGFVVGY
jgi:hypothetical protein